MPKNIMNDFKGIRSLELNQTLNSLSNLGSAIYFTSEPDLINALIFKINNDNLNLNKNIIVLKNIHLIKKENLKFRKQLTPTI